MRTPNINAIEFQFEFICTQNFEKRNTIFKMSKYSKELNHVEINCVRKGHCSSAKRRSRQRNNISVRALKVRRTAVDPARTYISSVYGAENSRSFWNVFLRTV